jgi:hypothetical protein
MDFKLTELGDLEKDSLTNNLGLVFGNSERLQKAYCRIKSISHNWFVDQLGADLEEIIGMPMNESSISLGEDKIYNVLMKDELFTLEEIYVETFKTSFTAIEIYVYLRDTNLVSCSVIKVDLDLVKGVSILIY